MRKIYRTFGYMIQRLNRDKTHKVRYTIMSTSTDASAYKGASERSLKLISRSRNSSGMRSRFSSSLTLLPLFVLDAEPLRRLSPPRLDSPAAAASSRRSSSSMAALIMPTRINSFLETSSTSDRKDRKSTSACAMVDSRSICRGRALRGCYLAGGDDYLPSRSDHSRTSVLRRIQPNSV